MPATYQGFLHRVIEDGIAATKADYNRPDEAHKLLGSLAGFEACRDKSPEELFSVLKEAQEQSEQSFRLREEPDTYWFKRCYTLEVEWVCNVVSAALTNIGITIILPPPTALGVLKAAEILGVKKGREDGYSNKVF